MILIWNKGNFENIRVQLNEAHGIPPEGLNGFRNGVERIDGVGRTTNYILPALHSTEDKSYIQIDSIEQFVIDSADEVYTGEDERQYLIDNEFIEEI